MSVPTSVEIVVEGGKPEDVAQALRTRMSVQTAVEAIAQWLRAQNMCDDYFSDITCDCGEYNTETSAPDLDKLADGVLKVFGSKCETTGTGS